jgi:hypothetical protein
MKRWIYGNDNICIRDKEEALSENGWEMEGKNA